MQNKFQSMIAINQDIVNVGFNFQRGGGAMMWSSGCDFYGNDFDQKQMQPQFCGDFCADNPKCSHFAWNQDNGGTCYLKAGFAPDARPIRTDPSFICGYRGHPVRSFVAL